MTPIQRAMFDRVYRANLWRGQESLSGPGSGPVATRNTRASLLALVDLVGGTFLDVGCGDGYWMPDLPGYIGIDPSTRAIDLHRERHPGRDLRVDHGEALPTADLAFSRDAMQHCSLADGLDTLARILASAPRWLVASTYVDGRNDDILTALDRNGEPTAYRPDLSAAPFGLGQPALLIFDGWGYEYPDDRRDRGKHLGAWRLR